MKSTNAVLIDIRQVATVLGCSARHVQRLADRGAMPQPVRLGALVRWSASEIDSWVAQGCQPCPKDGDQR